MNPDASDQLFRSGWAVPTNRNVVWCAQPTLRAASPPSGSSVREISQRRGSETRQV